MDGIHSPSIFAEEGVTVSGNVENKEQRSVDFTSAVYDNPEKTSHETYHIKPAQRLTTYYELMVVIIIVSAVLFIVAYTLANKKTKSQQGKSTAI